MQNEWLIIHIGTTHMLRVLLICSHTGYLYYKVVVTYPFSLYLICNTLLLSIMWTNQIQISWMCYKYQLYQVRGQIKGYHRCYKSFVSWSTTGCDTVM